MTRTRPARTRLMGAALVALLALALAACDQAATVADDPAADAVATADAVTVENMAFAPDTLTVPAGTTVTWTFADGAIPHDVVFDDGSVASEQLTDGTFSHTFEEPGTYTYHCSLHPNMTGTIEVTS